MKSQVWHLGDFVRITEDPMSFMIGEDLDGSTGIIIAINPTMEIYTVLLSGSSRTVRVLDFMIQQVDLKHRSSNRGRRATEF